MKTVLIVMFAATAAWSATIEGRVFDPSTAVVPGVRVVLLQRGQQQAVSQTSPDGVYRFDSLAAGTYEVRVLAPGFAAFEKRNVPVAADVTAQVNALLNIGEISETVTVLGKGQARPQAAAPQRIRVGGNVQATRLLASPRPAYPDAAREAGREGTVMLRAVISTEGNLLSIRALPGSDDELAAAATEAVKQWKYQPTLLNGKPVEVVTTIEVRFKLE